MLTFREYMMVMNNIVTQEEALDNAVLRGEEPDSIGTYEWLDYSIQEITNEYYPSPEYVPEDVERSMRLELIRLLPLTHHLRAYIGD